MIEVNSLVKTSPSSDNVFKVVEIDDTSALLEPTGELATAPNSYPFWWPIERLTLTAPNSSSELTPEVRE